MELRVGDVMTKGAIYVRPNENIKHVAEIMRNNDIDSIIVIDKKQGLGIITDRDIIGKVVAENKDPSKIIASELMTSPLITIAPNVDIDVATKKMQDKNVRRLVVKQGDNIIGILSEFDLVRAEPAMHLLLSEHSKWDIADISSPTSTISGICEVCGNYSENLHGEEGRLICDDCSSE